METADIPKAPLSMWIPEQNDETRALIGKLGEESSELSTYCHRASIQGLYAINPDTGKTNLEHIWAEIADVEAMISHMKDRRGNEVVRQIVEDRASKKFHYKLPWFDFLNYRSRDQA